jgi:hypothetical protein
MPRKILRVADAVVCESPLPNLSAADLLPYRVGISSFDDLHGAFQSDISRGREQQVDVIGHEHEGVELKSPFTAVKVQGLEKQSRVGFHDEKCPALERRERNEVGSGRREESCRFQNVGPQRLKPRPGQIKAVRLKSHPYRWEYLIGNSYSGKRVENCLAASNPLV